MKRQAKSQGDPEVSRKAGSEIEKVTPNTSLATSIPEFMKDVKDHGLEIVRNYVVPPRLKIVQKSAKGDLLELFCVGDVIHTNEKAIVAEMTRDDRGKPSELGPPFRFVPIFFFPEWAQWTPYSLRGEGGSGIPAIVYRTQDPNDALRQKCRNPKLRKEPWSENKDVMLNNIEHLNFLVRLLDSPFGNDLLIMSFQRGDHRYGTQFCNLIQNRRGPMYGSVFEARARFRKNTKGDWYGFEVSNPTDGSPWITDQTEFLMYKDFYENAMKAHRQGIIRPDYEDLSVTPSDDDDAVPASKSEF